MGWNARIAAIALLAASAAPWGCGPKRAAGPTVQPLGEPGRIPASAVDEHGAMELTAVTEPAGAISVHPSAFDRLAEPLPGLSAETALRMLFPGLVEAETLPGAGEVSVEWVELVEGPILSLPADVPGDLGRSSALLVVVQETGEETAVWYPEIAVIAGTERQAAVVAHGAPEELSVDVDFDVGEDGGAAGHADVESWWLDVGEGVRAIGVSVTEPDPDGPPGATRETSFLYAACEGTICQIGGMLTAWWVPGAAECGSGADGDWTGTYGERSVTVGDSVTDGLYDLLVETVETAVCGAEEAPVGRSRTWFCFQEGAYVPCASGDEEAGEPDGGESEP